MTDGLAERFCPHLGMSFDELYDVLEEARQHPPFHWPPLDAWVVTRHDDVLEVLRDPVTFSNTGMLRPVPWAPTVERTLREAGVANISETRWMGILDGDDHRAMRASVSRVFTPKRVQDMEPTVRAIANELLDQVTGSPFDLVESLAFPLPIRVIVDLIGAPAGDIDRLRTWTDDLVRLIVMPMEEAEQQRCAEGVVALDHYVSSIIEEHRSRPGEDFLSALIADADAGLSEWGENELRHLVAHGLILAGHETTSGAIANAVFHLLSARGRWNAARSNIGAAVDEALRYDTPTLGSFRSVTRDTTVGGAAIDAGARVYWVSGGANHDPAQHDRPEEWRLDRTAADASHLSFGHGVHYCLGAPLARLEVAVALELLGDRFPDLSLCADRNSPIYEPSPLLRHQAALWVRS